MDLDNYSYYGNQFALSPKFSEDVSNESMEIKCCFKSNGPFSHNLFDLESNEIYHRVISPACDTEKHQGASRWPSSYY